jgi:urease accessory protein UreH
MRFTKRDINIPMDFIGQTLAVGDMVAHTTINSQKAYFEFGEIVEILYDKRETWFECLAFKVRKPGRSKVSQISGNKLLKITLPIPLDQIHVMCGNPENTFRNINDGNA